ncbi:hypothetical protein [Pseudomonas qingdaonensis]|uniref:hypothetical protein n=1 Tax=Pseudomonas qingdaonensis TaxID=2056231 RepID=UPI00333EF92C
MQHTDEFLSQRFFDSMHYINDQHPNWMHNVAVILGGPTGIGLSVMFKEGEWRLTPDPHAAFPIKTPAMELAVHEQASKMVMDGESLEVHNWVYACLLLCPS